MPRVIHTRLLFWAYGMALTPTLVLIAQHRRGDAVLLAHEEKHCEQLQLDGTARFWWRYLTSRAHRQRYEVEAYRVSVAHRPDHIDRYAHALASKYRLKLTHAQARALLAA